VVLLQNCIDLQSGERNEVIHVELEGVSVVTEKENCEPMISSLPDPKVGFMLMSVLACFIGIQNLSVSILVCPCETIF
jgi:hypothetical protein